MSLAPACLRCLLDFTLLQVSVSRPCPEVSNFLSLSSGNTADGFPAGGGLVTPSLFTAGRLATCARPPLAAPPFRVGSLAPSVLAVLTVDQGSDGPRHSGASLHLHLWYWGWGWGGSGASALLASCYLTFWFCLGPWPCLMPFGEGFHHADSVLAVGFLSVTRSGVHTPSAASTARLRLLLLFGCRPVFLGWDYRFPTPLLLPFFAGAVSGRSRVWHCLCRSGPTRFPFC